MTSKTLLCVCCVPLLCILGGLAAGCSCNGDAPVDSGPDADADADADGDGDGDGDSDSDSDADADFDSDSSVCDEMGPLTIHPDNPRYFATGCGDPVYLTGSHTWTNFIDGGPGDPSAIFDYGAWLDFMESHGHNFMRLWMWEQAGAWPYDGSSTFSPHPFLRTGPGYALDGKPWFDLDAWNEAFFDRLRERVSLARERGIYVAVMLFDGWSVESKGEINPWHTHPFNTANNINGIDGDGNGDGEGEDTHTLNVPEVTAVQEEYVRRMIEAVNDMPNVLFEISNESGSHSTEWQYHMIDFIHDTESLMTYQHPVGMTVQWPGGTNEILMASPAEWISPNLEGGYRDNPPAGDGSKIILSDTDHHWGVGGSADWVWITFLRGLHPLFMDPYITDFYPSELTQWNPLRAAMGHTRTYAARLDLARSEPRGDLASSGFCLAVVGEQYVVYTAGGDVTLDVSGASGTLNVEWLEVSTGTIQVGAPLQGGAVETLTPPVSGAAVAFVE